MPTFHVVAERSLGIFSGSSFQPLNPFKIRDILAPGRYQRAVVREWDIEAKDEDEVRRLFDEFAHTEPLRGFTLVSVTERKPPPTTCGYCSFEEADGELIQQCARCAAADAGR